MCLWHLALGNWQFPWRWLNKARVTVINPMFSSPFHECRNVSVVEIRIRHVISTEENSSLELILHDMVTHCKRYEAMSA